MTPSHPVVSLLVGPLLLNYPGLSLLHRPPLGSLFGFQAVKSKPGQAVSPGMKDGEGREKGMRNRGWERPGGGNVEGAGEISSDRRWIALPKYCVIHQTLNDVSGISGSQVG